MNNLRNEKMRIELIKSLNEIKEFYKNEVNSNDSSIIEYEEYKTEYSDDESSSYFETVEFSDYSE